MERALLSRALGFRILPHQMDNMSTQALRPYVRLLNAYDAAVQETEDLKQLTPGQADLLALIDDIRKVLAGEGIRP